MQGIIDIEEILHFELPARSVVQRKGDQREERDPLVIRADEGEKSERNADTDELRELVRRCENDHGGQHAPNAVIHAVVRVRKKMRKTLSQKNDRGERAGEERPSVGTVLFQRVVKRVDQNDGKGKRDEAALIQRVHGEEIHELADRAEPEHLQEISGSVFRIFRALRDHVGEDGERKPADITQDLGLREQLNPDVVTGHGDQGKNFQLIARQPLKEFCFHKAILFSETVFLSV